MPAIVTRKAPRAPALDTRRVRRLADAMLGELGLGDAELSVLLTDDAFIRELNRKHRDIDRATDVLAFPMAAPDFGGEPPPLLLGDVVVSVDMAARQAKKRGHPLLLEVAHLLAHGLLHIVGYDHQSAADEREMNQQALRLVAAAIRTRPTS